MKTFALMDDDARRTIVEQWVREGTPLPGIALLLDVDIHVLDVFIREHVPIVSNLVVRLTDDEVERSRSSLKCDDYPPFPFRRR